MNSKIDTTSPAAQAAGFAAAVRLYPEHGGTVQVGNAHGPATKGMVRLSVERPEQVVVFLAASEATELAQQLLRFAETATR